MSSYSSGYGYGIRTSVLKAKGQTAEERAASEASLERIGSAIAASVASARDSSEARQSGPPRDAAHRAQIERVLAWRQMDVANGWKVAQRDVDHLQARLALPNADAAPVISNAIEADEVLDLTSEEPDGRKEWELQEAISEYCRSVSEKEFRRVMDQALAPFGFRIVRVRGWRDRQWGFGG